MLRYLISMFDRKFKYNHVFKCKLKCILHLILLSVTCLYSGYIFQFCSCSLNKGRAVLFFHELHYWKLMIIYSILLHPAVFWETHNTPSPFPDQYLLYACLKICFYMPYFICHNWGALEKPFIKLKGNWSL